MALEQTWLGVAGTALTGLGSTVNGLHSLYGLSHQLPWHLAPTSQWAATPAVAGGVVSGAAALASGMLTAVKIGSGTGAGISMSTLGLGIGCIYASACLAYFVHSLSDLNTNQPPCHAPKEGSVDAAEYPSPEWLTTRVLNWAVIGCVGSGKSTLINSIRGLRARDPDSAPVGVGHTTTKPRPYNFTGEMAKLTNNMARIWDLPGAGTREWPCGTYIRDAGLRYFDGVAFVTSGAFSEVDSKLIQQLLAFKVPYYLVRNKVDQDVVNNIEDNGVSVEATVSEIRRELLENGCDPARTFLISAKHPDCAYLDFGLLLRAMALDVSVIRRTLPEFQKDGFATLPTKGALPASETTWHMHRGMAAAAAAAAAAEVNPTTATDTNSAARSLGRSSASETASSSSRASLAGEAAYRVGCSIIPTSGDHTNRCQEDTQTLFHRFICL